MNGDDLIAQIRGKDIAIPIVAMSTGGYECLEKPRQLGANLCVLEPFDVDVVAKSVLGLVRR